MKSSVSGGDIGRLRDKFSHFLSTRLSPFKHRNFRIYFFAQTLSLVGSMANELARAYIVISLIGKAQSLGAVLLLSAVPAAYLLPRGGVWVDRKDVRKIMLINKSLLAAATLFLAYMVEFSEVKYWYLLVYAFFEACVIAIDGPAFQTLNVRLIPKEDLQQSIALNSTNFHAGRMIGPLIAASLMAFYGPSLVFLVDGLTFVVLAFVINRLALPPQPKKDNLKVRGAFKESLIYFSQQPRLRFPLGQLMISCAFVTPLMVVLFRSYFAQKFSLSAEDFGYLFTFPSLGALAGALSFAAFKPKNHLRSLKWAIPASTFSTIILAFVQTQWQSALFMTIVGFTNYLGFASLTATSQLSVKEEYRGRVSAVINLAFLVVGPVSAYLFSVVADRWGARPTMIALALSLFVFSEIWKFLSRKKTPDLFSRIPPEQGKKAV